jgi:2-polyprenyl-3-methyl-5-hydroxy-6-metoxy-1,4-benzoquinol methylase
MNRESSEIEVTTASPPIPQYAYRNADPTWPNHYIWPVLLRLLKEKPTSHNAVFEIGSGNGATANMLAQRGYRVVAIDPAVEGIDVARRNFPDARFHLGSAYDDLAGKYGTFPIVVSLEVIEHCFSPKAYLETMFKLIEPGGLGIISTPFHGYWKNLALSLANKWDSHLGPLWEGGHIKFFSEKTLAQALQSAGFTDMDFRRAGRFSLMAKSTVVAFRRPSK